MLFEAELNLNNENGNLNFIFINFVNFINLYYLNQFYKLNNINIDYMAHSFKTNSGYRTFGVFSEPADAGDYTYNKKARASFCVANNCTPAVKVGSQSNLLLFNRSNKISVFPCQNFINKANLNSNLITQLNLFNVPVIQNKETGDIPTTITPALNSTASTYTPPYLKYNIDPSGNLFGNTVCGINNYINYIEYIPPTIN